MENARKKERDDGNKEQSQSRTAVQVLVSTTIEGVASPQPQCGAGTRKKVEGGEGERGLAAWAWKGQGRLDD